MSPQTGGDCHGTICGNIDLLHGCRVVLLFDTDEAKIQIDSRQKKKDTERNQKRYACKDVK